MSDTVIEVRGLSRSFRQKAALQDVTLSVPKGSVFGLVGENGAGKTTLLKHLLGLLKARAGSVEVLGLNPVAAPDKVLSRVGYLSEDRDLPEWMRVDQLISYRASFYANWDHQYAAELVETFELPLKQRVKTLSRGQLARVCLLLAVCHRPELLLLDEPSSGLDAAVRRDILAAIIRTVADEGRTVLFSSHLLDEVQRVSDHVAMLHHGRLLLCGPLDTVLEQHSRFVFRLPDGTKKPATVPGAIACSGADPEWSVVCNGQQAEFTDWLTATGAEIIEEAAPTLEEIFLARASQPAST